MKNLRIGLLLLLAGCGGGDNATKGLPDLAPSADAAVEPDAGGVILAPTEAGPSIDGASPLASLATCRVSEGICSGTLDPTLLGTGVRAVRSPTSAKDGRHYFCYPISSSVVNGKFLLHLVGTGSDPQVDLAVTRRMCALGFVALSPMYVNDRDARSTCGADTDCFEGFRREIVQGGDFIGGVSVDAANSIESRVDAALAKLAATEPGYTSFSAFRDGFAARNFSKVVLSGHSQGSGHALYLAREYAALRVVLLAGPSDRLPAPASAPSRWITTFAARSKTTPANLYGFISEDDGIQGFGDVRDTWNAIGVATESCAHSASVATFPSSCRRVVLPSAGCTALDAHSVVVAENFDSACRAGRPPNRNTAAWTFLFGAP